MPDRIQQLLDRAELRRTLTRFLTEAGYFLYLNGSHEKAAEVLLGARAADSRDPVPIIAYAEVMLATGRAGKAERAAQQSVVEGRDLGHGFHSFANCQTRKNLHLLPVDRIKQQLVRFRHQQFTHSPFTN